jgi:hypothetical protein
MLKRLTVTGSTMRPRSTAQKGEIARALHEKVWPLLEAGAAMPHIHATFPLAEAARGARPDGEQPAHRQDHAHRMSEARAFRLLLVAVLLFGGVWPLTKDALGDATPMWFAAWQRRAGGRGRRDPGRHHR